MADLTPGSYLRVARRKKQWTQAQLARHLGMQRARLCNLEKDRRHPTREEWLRLSSCLALGPCPPSLELPAPQRCWRASPPYPKEPERSVWTRRQAARKTFGSVVDTLANAVEKRDKNAQTFLRYANLESGDEYFFWLKLLDEGGRPCRYSPNKAGFRTWAILEPKSWRQIGDLRAPCLELLDQGWLLFPQLTLDTRKSIYRTDALLCCRHEDGRLWVNIEIDGLGHDPRFDQQRQTELGLPTARVSATELTTPRLVPLLAQKLATHFPKPSSLVA